MSSLEKLHTGRGSMQGHHKLSDGFSDTSSSGSLMDDTDREVSNLTDRAFRSLCIGEEAIYNDSEFSSSPTERYKAFAEEKQQKTVVQRSSQETYSCGVQQHGEAGAQSEVATTFQHSYVDVTHQEQVFREGSVSYMNNGSKEVTWQQSRSASRVSSLIKAFSSVEAHQDGQRSCDVILAKDKYRDYGHESWDRSALLSIQGELSEFSSGYHQKFKSGPFQTYRHHFYTSDVANTDVVQMDTKVPMKSSKSKFKALNSTNCFFHSEFSPFQLWEDYNRFPFESTKVSGLMSANEFPRWYNSPMYKELKDSHGIPNSSYENKHFSQKQTQDVVPSQHARSTVIQKAFAIEKRCESEMASNYPPWKKSNNFVKNKLTSHRPSTVSPTNEKTHRPDSSLFGISKIVHDSQFNVEKEVDGVLPSSVTPFNITQLLTPVIHTRQETETSEILQFAHTPSISDYSSQGETDPKPLTDAKHLRDSYRARASSLLFNLKDNRKRVKSTYSPTKFKGLEVTDRNKQSSKLEGRESRFSDISVAQETAQENPMEMDTWASSNHIQELRVAPITPKDYTHGVASNDKLTLMSPQIQDGGVNFQGSSQGGFLPTDLLTNTESSRYVLSPHNLSTQDRSSFTSGGQLKGLSSTVSPTIPKIANGPPKTRPAHTLEQQRHGVSDSRSQNFLKQRQDFVQKTHFEYSQHEAVKEGALWDQTGSVNITGRETLTNDGRCEAQPFRGEIAALIEMDKQRKATARRYLPSNNDGYSVRKEAYMQKVNEDIKLGRLAKDEQTEVKEDTISSNTTSYSNTPVHGNQLNTFSRPVESYGVPKNHHQNKTSSPPKDFVHVYEGLQSYAVISDLAKETSRSERAPESHGSSNSRTTLKTTDPRALCAPSEESNGQNNEASFSYQQYRYEANKQWLMASTSEDKHIKDGAWTQRPSEKTAQMVGHNCAKSNIISNTLSSIQPSALHTTMASQNELAKRDATANPLQAKDSVIKNSEQNNPSLPSQREDKFSINDILAIRDSVQAKKVKENTFASHLAKSEHPPNTAENKLTITEANKEQETHGYKVPDHVSPGPAYLRRDSFSVNDGLANVSTNRKDKLMSKNNDKVTIRALERGQSKQEILTSKLKAHAQKEISAIKEKGLAKQGILARNPTKPSLTINSEVAQDGPEVHFARKEITADKLNHLFQDITYSSVTQHKDKTQNVQPANGSPPSSRKPLMEAPHPQEDKTAGLTKNMKSEYEKQDKPLATDRQKESFNYDKPPANDTEITKAFTQNVHAGDDNKASDINQCKHNVQKNINNYQSARISEDKQIRTSSEDINSKKQLAIQSLALHTSPIETKSSGHLTPSVKTKDYISHEAPALHGEKQTMQSDQTEKKLPKYHLSGNDEARSFPQYNYSEVVTTSNICTTKIGDKSPTNNTKDQKANSGLNKPSQKITNVQDGLLGLDRNMPRVKEATVPHKSGISVTAVPSKNERIKNSSEITVSQRTASSDDTKFKNGIPPANILTKSELTSKPQTDTMNPDTEQNKNENYKRVNTVTNNQFLSRTKELEPPERLVTEEAAAISKNNTTHETDLSKQKQNKTSPVRAVETTPANKTLRSQSESRTNQEPPMQISAHNTNQRCQGKNDNAKALLSRTKNETQPVNDKFEEFNEVSRDTRLPENESHTETAGDFPRLIGTSCTEENPKSKDKDTQEVTAEKAGSSCNAEPQKGEKALTQQTVTMEDGPSQKNNTHPLSKENEDSTREASRVADVLAPSKEEPAEEPVIFSICVSSKTETASDDEPMIYTICVSSKCHTEEQQNPEKTNAVKQEDTSSAETELPAERRVVRPKDDSVKKDKAENDYDGNKMAGRRETEVSSNTKAKHEQTIREPPATTDKHDRRKPSEIGSISTSYEELMAKYGLPVRHHGHLTSKHHMEDKREVKEKESEVELSQKTEKREINRSLTSKEQSSDNAGVPSEDLRQTDQQTAIETTQLLKTNEITMKQQANSSGTEQHGDNPSKTLPNITRNHRPELDLSSQDAVRNPKDIANAEQQIQVTENIEASKQRRRHDDVQLKDKKVEEHVRNTEKVQRLKKTENVTNNVSNSRKPSMNVEDTSPLAKQSAGTGDSTSTGTTEDVLKTPISKAPMEKNTVNTKLCETTGTGQAITRAKENPQNVDTEDTKLNKFLAHNTTMKGQKIEDRAKQKVQSESVSVKDAQMLKTGGKGESEDKNAQLYPGQTRLNTHNEITNRIKMVSKDGAATHVNSYLGKVRSNGEDVCAVVKHDQTSSEVPKIHPEDIKVSTAEMLSKQELMVDHNNQHEVIKRESLKETRGAVVTENVGDKDFTKQRSSPVKSLTVQRKPENQLKLKGTGEMTTTQKEHFEKEFKQPKRDSPEQAPSLNLRQEVVQTQDIKASDKGRKEDSGILSQSGQLNNNDGELKVNENRSSIREKKDRNDETTEIQPDGRSNANQHQPVRGLVLETKGKVGYEQGHASQQGINSEVTLSKPEVTQRKKKVTRPEISAIADYARLKVIAAEDDVKEINILPKINIYHHQPITELHKKSQGSVSVLDTGEESKRESLLIKREKDHQPKQMTLQLKERDKGMFISEKQNQSNPNMSTAEPKLTASGPEKGASVYGELGGTQERDLTNYKELHTKTVSAEQTNRGGCRKMFQSKNPQDANILPLQAEGKSDCSRSRQMAEEKAAEKENLSYTGRQKAQEYLPLRDVSATVKTAENPVNMTSPAGEEMEELQYYTVNALDSDVKPEETSEPPLARHKIPQNKDSALQALQARTSEGERKEEESSFMQTLTDYGKVSVTGQRSNSSSPAMGKPTMFRVKDNTLKTSSVTKTVKPRFYRSFSDDFRIGSPKEHLGVSEPEEQIQHQEPANHPVSHEPAIASHRLYKAREAQPHNSLSLAEYTAKQLKSHQRRSLNLDDDEDTRSVISMMSEDVENHAASVTNATDKCNVRAAYIPRTECYRDTYQRPASACYNRPESSCYDRPESACSDIRPLGKPPTVPPKSEKALRRAQRLTTRRMKKAEIKTTPEQQEQLAPKPALNVPSVPASPSDTLSTHLPVQATPHFPQYGTEPNYIPPTHSMVAQPFAMTQRKLLQDPNSGQYFMVDVPLPVKTKTFYDPETGKYVQLNVRQRSQSAHAHPTQVEMLNGPYMLYPGFLPMAASSLPTVRSSSQMSAPATLTGDQVDTGVNLWKENQRNYSRDSQPYPESAYRSYEQIPNPPLNTQNNISRGERHTDIITMSELEDFAMEST